MICIPATNRIMTIIGAQSYDISSEAMLQRGIFDVLTDRGYTPSKEYQLSPKDRIDFMIGNIGIEVKIGGARNALIRQLHRYAPSDEIWELLVVTTAPNLLPLPREFNGKPISGLVLTACLI